MSRLAEQADESEFQKVATFIEKHAKPYDPMNDSYNREPFASDVRSGKNTAIYTTHSYHTKVPPDGIRPFIRHYTAPGEIVLDPFCGSGMTGIAAIMDSRIPILIELSPAATFIAYNYCTPVDLAELLNESQKILDITKETVDWLYQAKCKICGHIASVNHVVWSDEFRCPRCSYVFLLCDVALKDGKILKRFGCPNCAKDLKKADCEKAGARPIRINYSCPKCGRIEDKTTKFDLEKIEEIERRWKRIQSSRLPPDINDSIWPLNQGKPLWYPGYLMMFKGEKWGDTWRAGVHRNITHVHQFFVTRNLWMLAKLWAEISKTKKIEIRQKLQWIFTSIIEGSSRLNRERTSGLPSKLSGTLYVSSFYREINVWKFFERKAQSLKRIRAILERSNSPVVVATQTASDLSSIPSDYVDYVFTDPPFGGNLMYSELNFLWESWLGRFTDTKEEAIINAGQGKGITEYKDLMTKSFKEIYRLLKPGRWMTMVFHNSEGRVWQAIQEGLAEAGFVIGMIGTFDKKQRSFKQATSSGAVGYDVVVNCYKPKATVKNGIEGKTTEEAIIGFLADKLRELPLSQCDERTARMLHSKTIGFFMQQNKPLEKLSFEDFQKILKKNFREIDDHWYLPYQRPKSAGQKKLFGFISSEAEAIEWLETFLRKPCKYGDIVADFFRALGPNRLKKDLQQILEENFIEENGVWRNPTTTEKERLVKKVSDHTARQIDQYLKGSTDFVPTDTELCKWIEFCYNNGLYQEGTKLFQFISENAVDPELFRKTKKIAEVCKLKSWE